MFMSASPRLGFYASDIFAFEHNVTARAQQRFNNRRMRKLIARNGKHPLSPRRTTRHADNMASEDWPMACIPDGIQDSFEAQQLRNRYLAGTAGSPYSDPDHYLLFQRMQQCDASLNGKRPVMDLNQQWQAYGVPDTTDIQSMFAPMPFQFGATSMDDISMSASAIGQNMPISSPPFPSSESAASFGSFSSTGASNLLDSGSIDGITSPCQQFDYLNSSFPPCPMLPEDMSNTVKAAPPSPPPFSEPTPALFFPSPPEHLAEPQCSTEDHHAMGFPVVDNYGTGPGYKTEPPVLRVLPSKPRKVLPEKPRSRVGSSSMPHGYNSPPRKVAPVAKGAPKPDVVSKPPRPSAVSTPILDPAERSAKDEYLLQAKREGLTYREIRVKGNFSEAESTLRGRYRTLTKSKEERVRKPEWSNTDILLLRRAVRKFARGNDPSSTKIPWKQVAEYIQRNGGSYLFGNATCRKKWDELVSSEV